MKTGLKFAEKISNFMTVAFAVCVLGAFGRVENGVSWDRRFFNAVVFILLTVVRHRFEIMFGRMQKKRNGRR